MRIFIDQLGFSFKKKQPLFSGLSLETGPGRIYGLFGLNGAGKTTLLKLMAGLLFPREGTCTCDGMHSHQRRPSVTGNLYFIPEQFELPVLTGEQYTGVYAPFYPDFDHEILDDACTTLGVDMKETLTKFSHGQQKKFLISFALATGARLLLMDEPTNGLDIPSKSAFRKLLAGFENEDKTIIISTHQVRDLGQCIDQVLVLHEGRMMMNTSLDNITRKFAFSLTEKGEGHPILYSEPTLGGFKSVLAADGDAQPSEIDLELLFNAVISRPELLVEHLNETEAAS